jgi:hypothetical protein
MEMKFNAKQAELKRYNFRSAPDAKLTISADSIPTLVPADSLKLFQVGDSAPYYKIQAIDYPTKANGYTYTEAFWKSFIAVMNSRPIPGSARGHETKWGARGPTDLLLIGGRVDSKGDGSGTVYLKNYILPVGESGDNALFITQNKAGMIDYSIVTYTKDEITTLPDGSYQRNCVESIGGERNDALDFGTGGMDMKTNANGQTLNSKCVTFAKSCIASGKLDSSSAWSFSGSDGDALLGPNGDNWANYAKYHLVEDQGATEDTKARWKYPVGKNGKVYRSALRAIASRASAQDLQDVSDAASNLIKEIDKKKGNHVDKEELLATLVTMKTNAQITLPEVAKAMGLEAQLRTPADGENEARMNAIRVELGDGDPVITIKAMKAEQAAGAIAARENAIVALVGPKANADGTPNVRFEYLAKNAAGLSGEKLAAKLEELKKDPVMVQLNALAADVNSPLNRIAPKGAGQPQDAGDGIPTIRIGGSK